MTKRLVIWTMVAAGTGAALVAAVPPLIDRAPSPASVSDPSDVASARGASEAAGIAAGPGEHFTDPLAYVSEAWAGGSARRADPAWREATLPAGTPLTLRLETSVATDSARVEDPVRARLAEPIYADRHVAIPAGSLVTGEVTQVRRSGKVKGRAYLALQFTSLSRADVGDRYRLQTRGWSRQAPGTKKKDALKIGVPAGAGAVIGGLIGGKKGLGVGAAIGGGAGTGVVMATRGQEVRLGRGAILIVRLATPLSVRVRA